MDNKFLIAGLLMNASVILIDRNIRKLPHWLYLSCLIIGILLMITGAFQAR